MVCPGTESHRLFCKPLFASDQYHSVQDRHRILCRRPSHGSSRCRLRIARYLTAVEQFRNKDPALPASWAVAFHAIDDGKLVVLQHMLLAMNPHINIDLAVAAAGTCPGASIASLQGDFY